MSYETPDGDIVDGNGEIAELPESVELYSCKICRGSGFDFIFDDLDSYNSHIRTEHPDSL